MSRALRALRSRWVVIGATTAAVVVMLAVLPVFGSDNPDADRLRLTSTTKAFFYGNFDPSAPGVITQPVTLARGCEISSSSLSGPLVNVSSTGPGGHRGPGYVDFGLGVKTGGSNGTPCSEIDGVERLKIASMSSSWSQARLDVEVKGGIWVIADMYSGANLVARHELLTGASIQQYNTTKPPGSPIEVPAPGPPYVATTEGSGASPAGPEPNQVAACADPNDSGPDANLKDNCMWTLRPGVAFDSIVLYAKNGIGTVSLEGGSDYLASDPSGVTAGHYDSLFYRALTPKDDSYFVDEDNTRTVLAPGVLANDGSTSGATVSVKSGVNYGTLSLDANGGFTYTPNANFNGIDSFTYTASSTVPGQLTGDATVTITVKAVNDPPEFSGSLEVDEGLSLTINGSDVATDVEGDSLSITAGTATPPSTISVSGGTATYTPDPEFCGADTISLTVFDGTASVTEDVVVNVVCLADDDFYSMDERTQSDGVVSVSTLVVPAPGVLGNDSDDPSSTTATELTPPDSGVLNLSDDGSFDFTPTARTPEQWGTDTSYDVTWAYTVTYADTSTQTATVTITVNRTLCENDTVTGQDGAVSGSFTLISATGCKDWVPVVATDGLLEDTVVFQPNTPDTDAEYDGTLTKSGVVIADGSLPNVILAWDPTPDDTTDGGYEPIPACDDKNPDPLIVEPVLPGDPEPDRGWCFYDFDMTLVGFQTFDIAWRVKGKDDPGFRY